MKRSTCCDLPRLAARRPRSAAGRCALRAATTNSANPPTYSVSVPPASSMTRSATASMKSRSWLTKRHAPPSATRVSSSHADAVGVEVVGGFVEQQHVGLGEQQAGQRGPHAPPAGQLARAGRHRRGRSRAPTAPAAPPPRARSRRAARSGCCASPYSVEGAVVGGARRGRDLAGQTRGGGARAHAGARPPPSTSFRAPCPSGGSVSSCGR